MRNNYFNFPDFIIVMLSFFITFSVLGQERNITQQEFIEQFQSALQKKDEQKLGLLVQKDRELIQSAIDFLFSEGKGAYQITNYTVALEKFMLAVELCQRIGDRGIECEINGLNSLGVIYSGIGKYEQALNNYQQALSISQKFGDRDGEGRSLQHIGIIYSNLGEYQQSLSYFQQAWKISKEIGNKFLEEDTVNSIGLFYLYTGKYEEALHYLQESLIISKEIEDKAGEGTYLSNIGEVYANMGESQQAVNYFHRALTIKREYGDRQGIGITLNNIGGVYWDSGEYQQALNYLQQALLIRREVRDKHGEAKTLHNIGTIYLETNEPQKALEYFQQAVPLLKEIGDKVGLGITLNNIGTMYLDTEDHSQALNYFQQALPFMREAGHKVAEGSALNNIALIYDNRNETQQALNYLQQALTIEKETGNKTLQAHTLNNIGGVYLERNEYQQALNYFQQALPILQEVGDKAGEKKALHNIGAVYEELEQLEDAVKWYKQSINVLEEIRKAIGGDKSKESFFSKEVDSYGRIVKILLQLGAFEEAFIYAERSKARSFLEQLYEASTGVKHGVDQELQAKETEFYGKLAVIEQNLKEQISDEQREQLLKERHSLEHELSVIQNKLREANPRYADLKYPQPVTVEQVQQKILKTGEVLVEYLQYNEEMYVFILTPTGFWTHTLNINPYELTDKIFELLFSFRERLRDRSDIALAYQLYHRLLQPLKQKIAETIEGEEIKNLIIIPDLMFFYLPFEMLVTKDGETPEYLVDRYTISYSPSASVLKPEILQTRQPKHYTQDLLALAPFGEKGTETTKVALRSTENLLLSDTLRSGLEGVRPLPYSAGEVQTISSLYPQSICKIGADATKTFFKDHAKGNRYLHLSTHGYLDSEHAMYSGLLFSDGMLQTYEIFNLDIDAELTVLSACQTGLGELKAGEGLVGLTRAFMYAGSPSVLVSLWPVSDPSTAAFMKRFYRNLNRGMTKAEALRETKIWMKAKSYHTDERGNVIKHDHPFYWAPFILVGAWE